MLASLITSLIIYLAVRFLISIRYSVVLIQPPLYETGKKASQPLSQHGCLDIHSSFTVLNASFYFTFLRFQIRMFHLKYLSGTFHLLI